MQRVELMMDAATRKWLANCARTNYWRVASHIDLEDLVQDGFVIWHKVQQRYREQGRTHAHIINTFKTSYRNHLHELSRQRTRAPVEVQCLDYSADDEPSWQPLEHGSQHLLASLALAPFRVRQALAVFSNPEALVNLRRPYRQRGDGSRETLNERLCRLAGFDPARVDLVTTLRSYLAD